MASCHCNNTCSRTGKRGACPCKQRNQNCSSLCRCGHLLPCSNRVDSTIDEDICFEFMKPHEGNYTDRKRIHHVEVPEIPTKVRKQMTNGRLSKIPIRQQPVASPVLSTETPKARSDRSTHPSMPKPSSTRLKCKPASARPKCRGASARSTSKSATRTSATSTSTSTSTTTTGTSQSATPIPNTNEEPSTEGLLKIKNFLDNLDETSRRSLLTKLIWQDKETYQTVMTSSEPPNPPPEDVLPRWCHCGNCRPMPTNIENRCCIKKRGQCVTATGKFQRVVMDEDVLDAAGAYRNDLYAYDHQRNNRMFRHTAYRQFILMRYGVLRSGERKVVPSCTVLKIRQQYPADNGNYTGFRPGRL